MKKLIFASLLTITFSSMINISSFGKYNYKLTHKMLPDSKEDKETLEEHVESSITKLKLYLEEISIFIGLDEFLGQKLYESYKKNIIKANKIENPTIAFNILVSFNLHIIDKITSYFVKGISYGDDYFGRVNELDFYSSYKDNVNKIKDFLADNIKRLSLLIDEKQYQVLYSFVQQFNNETNSFNLDITLDMLNNLSDQIVRKFLASIKQGEKANFLFKMGIEQYKKHIQRKTAEWKNTEKIIYYKGGTNESLKIAIKEKDKYYDEFQKEMNILINIGVKSELLLRDSKIQIHDPVKNSAHNWIYNISFNFKFVDILKELNDIYSFKFKVILNGESYLKDIQKISNLRNEANSLSLDKPVTWTTNSIIDITSEDKDEKTVGGHYYDYNINLIDFDVLNITNFSIHEVDKFYFRLYKEGKRIGKTYTKYDAETKKLEEFINRKNSKIIIERQYKNKCLWLRIEDAAYRFGNTNNKILYESEKICDSSWDSEYYTGFENGYGSDIRLEIHITSKHKFETYDKQAYDIKKDYLQKQIKKLENDIIEKYV